MFVSRKLQFEVIFSLVQSAILIKVHQDLKFEVNSRKKKHSPAILLRAIYFK